MQPSFRRKKTVIERVLEWAIPVIALIAIALFFWVLLVGWPMLQCHLRWSDSGMDYRYKMFQGCQISPKTGQWVPASTFRTN